MLFIGLLGIPVMATGATTMMPGESWQREWARSVSRADLRPQQRNDGNKGVGTGVSHLSH
jgi:hypothetical protein